MITKGYGVRGHREDEHTQKLFSVLAEGMRRCLICEGMFSRRAAAEHAKIVCYPPLVNRPFDEQHEGR
jgi:hypothetical protein